MLFFSYLMVHSGDGIRRDLPVYGQFYNGCGLASLLMCINPEKNGNIKKFLDDCWDSLKNLFIDLNYKGKEYRWAIVLQYLLLKILSYSEDEEFQKVYDFFNERMEWTFEDVRIINRNDKENQKRQYMESNRTDEALLYSHYLEDTAYVTPLLVIKNLHIMKIDMELRVLAEIFNYEYQYMNYDDITGAISFLKKELKKKKITDPRTREKWLKLEELSRDPDVIMIYGKFHHWMAIRGVYRIHQIEEAKHDDGRDRNSACNDERDDGTVKEDKVKNMKKKSSGRNDKTQISEDDLWNPKAMIVELNDPSSEMIVTLNFRQIEEQDRILVFRKRPLDDYPAFPLLIKFIKRDIPLEREIYLEYLEKRKKKSPKKTSNVPEKEVREVIKKREDELGDDSNQNGGKDEGKDKGSLGIDDKDEPQFDKE